MKENKEEQVSVQALDAAEEMSEWMEKNWKILAEAVAQYAIFCPVEKYKE